MIDSLNAYWNGTQWFSFWDFWFPVILTFLHILGLTFTLLKLISRGDKPEKINYLTVFIIHRAFIWACCLVAMGWVAYICWYWTSHLYGQNHREFAHLLCLILSLAVALAGYISLRKYYSRETLRAIMPVARTYNEAEQRSTFARKGFGTLKLASLTPFLGFLLLLLLLKTSRSIIVIFLDNSPSMELGLALGQQALSKTFSELPANTEIVLASFPAKISGKPAVNVDDILRKEKTSGLLVSSQEFANPVDADGYLRGITIGDGSPITEAIWDLFLTLKASRDQTVYDNRKLLIVTDGGDAYTSETANRSKKFLCSKPSFEEFFNSIDVHMISINNDAGRFFEDARNCGYDIQDGNSLDSYTAAVDDALGTLTRDWNFIWWMLILLGIFGVSCLIIYPASFN
ncbi:hypothetical protein [Dyadobacter diqingensis]|uniref:hypothetical protein n=1 Tax=Dyadobacter diqingensis TaxID=2938121 RepID=UPI0020C1AE13|nr:hypothetical protein [Dyadobacter diqingensis]